MSAPKTPPSETSSHGHEVATALSPLAARPGDERFVAHLATAGDLVAGGRFREAEVEVLRALSGLQADLRALNLLALVRFKLGRFEEARATYREIAAAAPNDVTARRNLGLLALKLEQIDEAIPELEMAARLAPADKQAWSYLGYAYAKKGQSVPAAAAFRRAGQDALADELEHAATAPRPSSNPKLATLQPAGGTPPPAAAPAGLAARSGTPASVVPPASVTSPPARGADDRAVAAAPRAASQPSAAAPAAVPPVAPPPPILRPVAAPALVLSDAVALEPEGPGELTAVPLLGFVLARLGLGAPPRAPSGEALRLGVEDDAYVRAGAAVAAMGVRFEPAFRRIQGRRSAEPLAPGGVPFFRLVGPGEVWVAGAPGAWQAVSLEDDILYVREDRVLAFSGGVSWEAGAVPGDGLRMLQFRGRGCVVLQLDTPPAAVKVTEDRPAFVSRAHLLGWVGRLVTHKQRFPSAAPFDLTCQGEGVMLFELSGDSPALPGARSDAQKVVAAGSTGGR